MIVSALLFLGAAVASAVLTGLVVRVLRRWAILDHPNARSSHTHPTPRGGGWGVILVVVPAWLALGLVYAAGRVGSGVPPLGPVPAAVPLGMVLLALVSWLDDRRGLTPGPRLLAQAVAVALGLSVLGDDARVFQGWLPWGADRAATALCWLWFINLFNFMDGIDGLAGVETAMVAGGVALVALVAGEAGSSAGLAAPAAILAGAALGFLLWNWHPAKVFLGDVGSVPIGFALGWLLVTLAAAGFWPAALLLPLFFVADASLTLGRRLLAGQRIWQPHREHFYQKAVQGGSSHAQVARAVMVANLALVGLALGASEASSERAAVVVALVGGGGVVLGLLGWLRGVGRRS